MAGVLRDDLSMIFADRDVVGSDKLAHSECVSVGLVGRYIASHGRDSDDFHRKMSKFVVDKKPQKPKDIVSAWVAVYQYW
ncbi:hypothetical protein KBC03_08200 [Patescibacteria group bacterium]|nr:hypothetical protein [Patescibacteria group bacterium]